MGKSARVLGWGFGRNAREMNELLTEHGYLYGNPGAYGLTEKGQQFANEQYHSRGTGGYAHYNRNWETRTWNDETAAALKADMEANPGGVREDVDDAPADEELGRALPADEQEPVEAGDLRQVRHHDDVGDDDRPAADPPGPRAHDDDFEYGTYEDDDDGPPLAIAVAVIGAVLLAPHVEPFWNNKVKPAAKKLREKFTKQGPDEATDASE